MSDNTIIPFEYRNKKTRTIQEFLQRMFHKTNRDPKQVDV
jgi:hypothetical protein